MTVGSALFALGLILSWANSSLHIVASDRPLYALGPRIFQGALRWQRGVLVGLAFVAFLVLVVLFADGWNPEWVAAAILVAMFGLQRWEFAQWPPGMVVRLGKYVAAGACLAGWLVASLVLQALAVPDARHLAWNAACGVMAGVFTLAGVTKLREAGLAWLQARHHALLVAERAFTGPRWLRALRMRVAQSPGAARIIGLYGLGIELGSFFFVVPDARVFVLAGLLALIGGFLLLLGYIEVEWAVTATAVLLLAR